ncbi:MAG: hypothetical protein ACRDQ5_05805 [Sciscionella sp.]
MRPGDGTPYGQQQQQQDSFSVVWRGYDREAVHRYLGDREQSIRQIASQRDAARSRADELSRRLDRGQAQISELSKKIDALCKPPLQAHDLSERLDRMLKLANAEAAEIISKAETEASDLRGNYERKLATLEEDQKRQAAEHSVLMESTKRDAEKAAKEAEQRRAASDAEAEARIKKAEATSRANTERQESASKEQTAKEQAASKAEAERVVREATETARRRIEEANGEVERLRGLRSKISTQLDDALGRIKQSGSLLEPLADERDTEKTVPSVTKSDKAEQPAAGQEETEQAKTAETGGEQPGAGAQAESQQPSNEAISGTTQDAGAAAESLQKTKTFAPVTPPRR